MQFTAYASGIATLLVLWILYRLFAGTWDLGKIYEGADGNASTSKLQWFLWTVVIIFAYVVVYAARTCRGDYGAITDIPENLLIAMGFSITSMVAAKGITVSQVASGQAPTKSQAQAAGVQGNGANPPAGGGVFKDNSGVPDLSKIQVMAWTLIAIGTYLIRLFEQMNTAAMSSGEVFTKGLPDIDQALMVLMGLGHGAYLGKKLVTTSTPRLTGVAPGQGPAGTAVTLSGMAFGATQDGSLLTIDGMPIYPGGLTWGDTQITFPIPATHPNGTAWGQGQRIVIGLTVNGQQSANTLPFTVTAGAQNGGNPPPPPNPQPVAPPPPPQPPVDNPAPPADDAQGGAPPVADVDPTTVNPQITDS